MYCDQFHIHTHTHYTLQFYINKKLAKKEVASTSKKRNEKKKYKF